MIDYIIPQWLRYEAAMAGYINPWHHGPRPHWPFKLCLAVIIAMALTL